MFFKNCKRGQVTIFIIIAVIAVVMGILFYSFYPQIRTTIGIEEKNPTEFIQSCMEEEVGKILTQISLQGGSLNPEHYLPYDNSKVGYLCYTAENYKTCAVQEPFLKQNIEDDLKENIQELSDGCFQALEENYKNRGYTTSLEKGEILVQLLPKKVLITLGNTLTLTQETSERYKDFTIILNNNNIYELANIAMSIIAFESTYGDSETTLYMNLYRDLKVEKKKQSEGTTVYILTNREVGNKFQFASRSVAWPSGYSL